MKLDQIVERRAANRNPKLAVLAVVTVCFILVSAVGDQHPQIDKYSHLVIIGYLFARVFIRGI